MVDARRRWYTFRSSPRLSQVVTMRDRQTASVAAAAGMRTVPPDADEMVLPGQRHIGKSRMDSRFSKNGDMLAGYAPRGSQRLKAESPFDIHHTILFSEGMRSHRFRSRGWLRPELQSLNRRSIRSHLNLHPVDLRRVAVQDHIFCHWKPVVVTPSADPRGETFVLQIHLQFEIIGRVGPSERSEVIDAAVGNPAVDMGHLLTTAIVAQPEPDSRREFSVTSSSQGDHFQQLWMPVRQRLVFLDFESTRHCFSGKRRNLRLVDLDHIACRLPFGQTIDVPDRIRRPHLDCSADVHDPFDGIYFALELTDCLGISGRPFIAK